MTDYDWSNGNGDQKGLEDWWVNMWTNYVVNYGIDGYRLDLGSTRVDLWSRIRDNAAGAGHPIIIMPESYNETGFKNSVYDLWQYDISLPDNMALLGPTHKITVYYGDGSSSSAYISNTDLSKSATGLSAVYRGIDADKVGTISKNPDGILDNHATIYGLDASKTISNVVIDSGNGKWALNPNGNWYLSMERNNTSAEVYFSPFPDEPEVQAGSRKYYIEYLSNHDFGDYQLKGSRFKAGYSLLFAPTIPLFMSGEEFNNPYTPVPNKSNCLYGAVSTADGGCGGWLYASQLQWQNLQTSPNKEFYNDFKKIVALRKNEPALNYFAGSLGAANLITVGDFNSNIAAPVPYIRWVNGSAILVAGNGNTASAAQMALDLSKYLAPVGLDGKAYYNIEDLWSGTGQNYSKNDLANFNFQIAPDNFRIFKIIQTNSVCAAGQIVGCQVCNPDGLGWQDDNSKCPGGEICSAGTCVAAGSGGGGSSGGGGGGSAATTTTTTTVAKTGNPSTGSGSSSRSGGSSSSSKPVAKMTRAEILAAIAKIQALIADLQKQLAAMGGGTAAFSCIQITKNLFYGMVNDPQIKCLQEVLKSQGYAVIASGNYDAATKAAVALFQQKYAGEILAPYHLTRGSGNVGNATRSKINSFIVIK
jgi:hypothetical protein